MSDTLTDTIGNAGIELASNMGNHIPNYVNAATPEGTVQYFAFLLVIGILGAMFIFFRFQGKNKQRENTNPSNDIKVSLIQLTDSIEKLCSNQDKNTEKLIERFDKSIEKISELSNRLHMMEKIYELGMMKDAAHK